MSGQELESRYNIGKSQFHNRKSALPHIRGVIRGRKKVFTVAEIFQLDAVHWYLRNGYQISDVQDAYKDFQADESTLAVENLEADEWGEDETGDTTSSNLTKVSPQSVEAFNRTMGHVSTTLDDIKAGQKFLKDPLRTLKALQEASDNGWEISSKIMASILEVSSATVHSWTGSQRKNGFLLERIGPGKWRVFREDEGKHQRKVKREENS